MQVLNESLEVCEKEGLVFLDRPSDGAAELIALKRRRGSLVEIVGSIERVVAQELIDRAVQLIGARLGHDGYLRARPLAVFGAIGVAQYIELAHRLDAQQVLARAARLHVVLRSAGELHAVQQKQVLLRAIAGSREIVACG